MSGMKRAITCGWWLSCARVKFRYLNFIHKKIKKVKFSQFKKAGTLDILLEQDGCLPESSIKHFGIDICEGLFYIHSLGLLFCDLIPRKVIF